MGAVDHRHQPPVGARTPKLIGRNMASKLANMKARVVRMNEGSKRVAANTLHTGETLIAGAGGAYLEGKMSDTNGEWGVRNVPYLYLGGGFCIASGLILSATSGSGKRGDYAADLMSLGSGLVGGHLFRTMYEAGLEAKNNAGTSGRRRAPRQMTAPQGNTMAAIHAAQRTQAQQRVATGSGLDGL